MWTDHRCYGYIINWVFRSEIEMFWYFTGVYTKTALHGRLEIWNFYSRVENYFTCLLHSLVKYFRTLEEKFCISVQPCKILYLCYENFTPNYFHFMHSYVFFYFLSQFWSCSDITEKFLESKMADILRCVTLFWHNDWQVLITKVNKIRCFTNHVGLTIEWKLEPPLLPSKLTNGKKPKLNRVNGKKTNPSKTIEINYNCSFWQVATVM